MEWTVDCGLNGNGPHIFEYLVPHWWNSVERIRKCGHDLGGCVSLGVWFCFKTHAIPRASHLVSWL